MTAQIYVTYIATAMTQLYTMVWDTAMNTKEMLWDEERGRAISLTILLVMFSCYVGFCFIAHWQHAIMQFYSPTYQTNTSTFMQRMTILESKHQKLSQEVATDLELYTNWIKTLEGRIKKLEDPPAGIFNFSTPFFTNERRNSNFKPYHCRVSGCDRSFATHQEQSQHASSCGGFDDIDEPSSSKRIKRSDIRKACRTIYGDNWYTTNKTQRVSAMKKKLERERDESSKTK